MEILAYQLLCAFGSVALAAATLGGLTEERDTPLPAKVRLLGVAGAGLLLSLVAILAGVLVAPAWAAAGCAATTALAIAVSPPTAAVRAACAAVAGVLVGLWGGLIADLGAPLALVLPFVAAPALVCARLVDRRPGFAPPVLREEGLALLLLFGLATAFLPSLTSGWHSAGALNAGARPAGVLIGPGLTVIVASTFAAGGLIALRRRWARHTPQRMARGAGRGAGGRNP